MRDEIGHDLAVAVTDGRALGNGDDQVVSAGAVGIAPFAVHTGGGSPVGVVSERDQRGDISIGDEPHRAAAPAVAASSVGDKALKDGCKQRYATNKKKYNACVAGNNKSNDAQIDGCYARYKHQRDKLKQCLGR